jgi:hypothetical protein
MGWQSHAPGVGFMYVVTCVMNGKTNNTNRITMNYTVMHYIMMFLSMIDHMYNGGPIRL